MNQAAELMYMSRNAIDAMERAESAGAEAIQVWEPQRTFYIFEDGSVLVVSGSQVNVYVDLALAKKLSNTI